MRSPSDATPGELQALCPRHVHPGVTDSGPSIQRAGQDDKGLQTCGTCKTAVCGAQYATPLPRDGFDRR